jgi:hypothetical protein
MLRFAEMLAPTIQAMLRASATPKQVSFLLRRLATLSPTDTDHDEDPKEATP